MMKKIAMLLMVLVLVFGVVSEAGTEGPFDADALYNFFEQSNINETTALLISQAVNVDLGIFRDPILLEDKTAGSYFWNAYRKFVGYGKNLVIENPRQYSIPLLENGDYRSFNLRGVIFRGINFKAANFGIDAFGFSPLAADITGAWFENCSFENLYLPTVSGYLLNRVIFFNCDFKDVNFSPILLATSVMVSCEGIGREIFEEAERERRGLNGLPELSALEEKQAKEIRDGQRLFIVLWEEIDSLNKKIEEQKERLDMYGILIGNNTE